MKRPESLRLPLELIGGTVYCHDDREHLCEGRAGEEMEFVVHAITHHEALVSMLESLVTDSAPHDQEPDESIGNYTCCGVADYSEHEADCWWVRARATLKAAKGTP